MARRPNYAYEKNARARAKAAKREAKRQAKLAARAGNAEESGETPDGETPDAENPGTDAAAPAPAPGTER